MTNMEQKDWSGFAEGGADKNGWRDIASAPKTTHSILVWVPENRCIFTVSWRKATAKSDGVWEIFGGGWRSFLREPGPSHWQPVPEAPEQEQC